MTHPHRAQDETTIRFKQIARVLERAEHSPSSHRMCLDAMRALRSLEEENRELRASSGAELRGFMKRAYDAPTWMECIQELEEGLGWRW